MEKLKRKRLFGLPAAKGVGGAGGAGAASGSGGSPKNVKKKVARSR